jgi:hypothetical protein
MYTLNLCHALKKLQSSLGNLKVCRNGSIGDIAIQNGLKASFYPDLLTLSTIRMPHMWNPQSLSRVCLFWVFVMVCRYAAIQGISHG